MDATPSSAWYTKKRYHHGELHQSALLRGREIVAAQGPGALTLRGLARDLGVTAPALVHHFGSLAGLKAAVAASVLEQLEATCGVAAPHSAKRRTAREVGEAWISFAADNANLYRLASGEGWHAQPARPTGLHGIGLVVPSPRRALEGVFLRQTRRYGVPGGDAELARYLSSAIHGLSLARLDGVPDASVLRGLDRSIAVAA